MKSFQQFITESREIEKGVERYVKVANDSLLKDPKMVNFYKDNKYYFKAEKAKKYWKVWKFQHDKKSSIAAFIDIVTGDIFKPAGVNSPAPRARGNVVDKQYMDGLPSIFRLGSGHLYMS